MNLKQYLKIHKIRLTDLARSSGIPYSTVNDIANGRVDIDRVQTGITVRLAEACGSSFEEFYRMAAAVSRLPSVEHGRLFVRNKRYYVEYDLDGEKGTIYLYKVTPDGTRFVKSAAEWAIQEKMEEIRQNRQDEEVRKWMETISS